MTSSREPAPEADAGGPPAPQPREYAHRAAPKYRSFIATGVLLGALVTALLYWLTPSGPFSTDGIVGYLGSTLVILGAVLGATVALLIERGQNRRSGRR
jgi:hypothetical protein